MTLRRDFLLVVTLTAAAMPALGQTATPSAGSVRSGSNPDFSGIWSHPGFPGFEPLASGPTSVINTVRRPQTTDADGRILPPVNKLLVSNPAKLVGDYTIQN